MPHVVVLTDAAADLAPEVIERLRLGVITADEGPFTASYLVDRYARVMSAFPECTLLALHAPEALGGASQAAFIAREVLGRDIVVVDTRLASSALGLVVREVAERAAACWTKAALMTALPALLAGARLCVVRPEKPRAFGSKRAWAVKTLDESGAVYTLADGLAETDVVSCVRDCLVQGPGAGEAMHLAVASPKTIGVSADGWPKRLGERLEAALSPKTVEYAPLGAVTAQIFGEAALACAVVPALA